MKKNLSAIVTGAGLLILWQIGAGLAGISHILPRPTDVLVCLWNKREVLFKVHMVETLKAIVIGYLIAIVIGVLLAVIMDLSEKLEAMMYPVFVIIETIPIMCIAPLFVLWFGYTLSARILAIVLSTFFSITVNTFDGLKKINKESCELMKTYGAKTMQLFWHIKLPTALPYFMTSLKITFPWAVIGAAIAEWLGANRGLGYYSKLMVSKLDGGTVFAAVLILSVIAVAGIAVIKFIDLKFVFWRSDI